ncbi:MAG: ATP-binding protein [Acetobacter aceti]|uniref:histidine kinase n=1 Tax=Acetobacter aceti TaxID=435 RepID=A0A1U9KH36_ACEAC|nr:ATP-binding protein [Acetobacter aceti]AQS85066.1 histidine kinase [Acetobacter aceti]
MSARRPLVLLVGQSETTDRFSAGLVGHGYEVKMVADAEAALDSLDQWPPAILITEFSLPGMTGCKMSRQLRLNRLTRSLPIIMLTDDEPMICEAFRSGIDVCVSRKADPAFLAVRIETLLRGLKITAQAMMRERFRRPTVAIATMNDGWLQHWPAQPGQKKATPPVIELLRGEGVDTILLDPSALAGAPDFWLPAVDCVMVDLSSRAFDGLAFCRMLDRQRYTAFATTLTPPRLLGFGGDGEAGAIAAYEAGVDDCVGTSVSSELLLLHVRSLLYRKAILDESLRSEAERAARDAAMEGARAKTVLADALEQANDELGSANRKLIEAQTRLVQSAKMASLGELVAGIAHEFNNPLAFVIAHETTVSRTLEGALSALDSGDVEGVRALLEKGRDRLASTSIGLGRMRDLVSSLRRFSRLDQGAFEDIDMPDAINTVLALLSPKLSENIRVDLAFDAPPVLRCQAALVHQVVMNIISNAADALLSLPESAQRVPLINISTALSDEEDGTAGHYLISICDNGPGISPFMRERVFEPFFTTKPVGEGTGLGLATAYGIVQAHGGTIEVSKSSMGGACFTVAIPCVPVDTTEGTFCPVEELP